MLRFGRNNLNNGFTEIQMGNHLTELGFDLANNILVVDLYFRKYFAFNTPPGQPPIQNANTIHFLNPDGYFDLLQHESTVQSSKIAKSANYLSIISLSVSALSLLLSLYSIFNVENVIKIDQKQIDEIKTSQEKTTKAIINLNALLNKKIDQVEKKIVISKSETKKKFLQSDNVN